MVIFSLPSPPNNSSSLLLNGEKSQLVIGFINHSPTLTFVGKQILQNAEKAELLSNQMLKFLQNYS